MAATPPSPPKSDDGNDSTMEDGEASDTMSIRSSEFEFPEENGRTYHRFCPGIYFQPNDAAEQGRLNLQTHMLRAALNNRLFFAPIERPTSVLDLGTGTGYWAIEMGDAHPQATVLGVDLSPIQPVWMAPNVAFEMFNYEDQWFFRRRFDLIFGRMLIGAVEAPAWLLENAFDSLVGGGTGCIELQDVCPPVCDDGTIPRDGALRRWTDLYCRALRLAGRDPHLAARYGPLLMQAGFVDVRTRVLRLPQNKWPKDPHLKVVGEYQQVNITDGLEGMTMRLFTTYLGWSADEVRDFLVDVEKEVIDPRIHAYWPL